MARRPTPSGPNGYSLVEMMVALLFVMILMAGMSTVFKSTLNTFTQTGEKLSSSRRNRMSIDLLYDDLNNAGMYLTDLSIPTPYSTSNEGFYILPDAQAAAGTPIPGVTQGADELYFCMDESLPFEGTLKVAATPPKSAAELVMATAAATTNDFTYTLDCKDISYAKQVAVGQTLIFKDTYDPVYITSIPSPPTNGDVTVIVGADPSAATTGSGASGLPNKAPHITGTSTVFVRGKQQVRYSIVPLNLDPANSTASTLCLVRDQGLYLSTGFTPTMPQQIVTENVSGFRVFISGDAGKTWVGGAAYTTWAAMKTGLNAQLATSGRPDYTSIGTDLNWFRSVPVMVRLDVTTRTARQRPEYSTTGTTLAYQEQVQSVVMVPRHFGLSMN